MNFLLNMLSGMLSAIDRLLGGMDKRTQETVKQAGYILAFAVIVGSVGFGIHLGRKAAKIGAMPNFKSTNQIFEVDVKRNRQTAFSRTMVESDGINEITDPELKRILFPSKAGQEPTASETVIEPETERHAPAEGAGGSDRLSEIDRTDGAPAAPDVRTLKKKEHDDAPAPGVLDPREAGEGAIPRTGGSDVRKSDTNRGDASEPASGKTIRVYRKNSPNPLDRGSEVIDR